MSIQRRRKSARWLAREDGTPVFLFTDFGTGDIYVGRVKAALYGKAPQLAEIDVTHDAPSFEVRLVRTCLPRWRRPFRTAPSSLWWIPAWAPPVMP